MGTIILLTNCRWEKQKDIVISEKIHLDQLKKVYSIDNWRNIFQKGTNKETRNNCSQHINNEKHSHFKLIWNEETTKLQCHLGRSGDRYNMMEKMSIMKPFAIPNLMSLFLWPDETIVLRVQLGINQGDALVKVTSWKKKRNGKGFHCRKFRLATSTPSSLGWIMTWKYSCSTMRCGLWSYRLDYVNWGTWYKRSRPSSRMTPLGRQHATGRVRYKFGWDGHLFVFVQNKKPPTY